MSYTNLSESFHLRIRRDSIEDILNRTFSEQLHLSDCENDNWIKIDFGSGEVIDLSILELSGVEEFPSWRRAGEGGFFLDSRLRDLFKCLH